MTKTRAASVFAGVIIGLGICSMIFVLAKANIFKVNFGYLLFAVFALGLKARRPADINELRSDALMSGSLVTLGFLLQGGLLAVMIASLDAVLSGIFSARSRFETVFRTASAALATFVPAFLVKQYLYPSIIDDIHNGTYANLFIALAVFSTVRFFVTTALAAVYEHLSEDGSFDPATAWSFVTYAVAAVIAGFMSVLIDRLGMQVIFAAIPIVIFVFLTNRMYIKNVEISRAKAEESKRYAETLEAQASALRESEERFRTAFDFAPIGFGLVSEQARWQKVNHALCEMLGYEPAELVGEPIRDVFHPDERDRNEAQLVDVLAGTSKPLHVEQRFVCKDGRTVWIAVSAAAIAISNNSHQLILQVHDVTDRHAAAEKLRHEAKHDGLTGLPNRNHFIAELERALEKFKADPENSGLAVLFIDLDRFKLINDNYGHLVGDALLTQIAFRIRNCLRPNDLFARLAGDEFTIMLEGVRNMDDVVAVARKIENQFAAPFIINGHQIFSSASIGILRGRDYHSSVEELLRDADVAMYQAKAAGRARYEIFDRRAHSDIRETFKMESELRTAIGRGDLSVVYQPIYSTLSGSIEGFEALARWEHATEGFIPPDKFIRIAEESGQIVALGEQILGIACRDAATMVASGKVSEKFSMSVNVSCSQLMDYSFVETLLRTLDRTGLEPERLRLEITESAFCKNPERGSEILYRIRDLGVSLSIDDFGTGYSNLKQLSQLPVSTIKLDRSFVSTFDIDRKNRTIMDSIMTMAQGLGMATVAEGVETTRQLALLREIGCDSVQGYLLSRPVRFEKAMTLLELAEPVLFDRAYENAGIESLSTVQ